MKWQIRKKKYAVINNLQNNGKGLKSIGQCRGAGRSSL